MAEGENIGTLMRMMIIINNYLYNTCVYVNTYIYIYIITIIDSINSNDDNTHTICVYIYIYTHIHTHTYAHTQRHLRAVVDVEPARGVLHDGVAHGLLRKEYIYIYIYIYIYSIYI